MSRDPRYDILFEPVKIGPVTARNRFYQVPHCNGLGHRYPQGHAAMRGMKAEGGWAVVSTEECEIHPSGDLSPYVEARIWDDHDIHYLVMMTEAVHEHGSLAAIQLSHSGPAASNLYSREIPIGPTAQVNRANPFQIRAMDRADIRNYRRWHRDAAVRARKAGFDIIYVYAGHDLGLPMHFLQKRRNQRIDEYGGSLENRARLFRELIEDTKSVVGDTCAVAVRFAVDEMMGDEGITSTGEGRDVVAMLAELPDLWDVNLSAWPNDSQTSRFSEEGFQEPFTAFVKTLTTKPVVGVGRYTSPDRMVSLIKKGALDMIGAARPSISDPYLPKKIEEGRLEDIRECIGCNICVTADSTTTPLRCTQNPTMGEEWRKGWHPETMPAKASFDRVLIVGGGPAGLEAARALGLRGYEVALAEASTELGGRVNKESRLPGLAAWGRVRDYRRGQIAKMNNVQTYLDSHMSAASVLELGFERVVLATGCHWRKDGIGRSNAFPIVGLENATVFSPNDIMDGNLPTDGPVLVYDDDMFYMAGVLAERLVKAGLEVVYVTPGDTASSWTVHTLELDAINKRLRTLGVKVITASTLLGVRDVVAELAPNYGETSQRLAIGAVVPVTSCLPEDSLFHELMGDEEAIKVAGIKSITRIGDCLAPGPIAYAVYAGHRYARELDTNDTAAVKFRRPLPYMTTP